MKNPEIFFRPLDGSAPLSIYWYPGPYGNAIEADNEDGVGFFSATGELLAVQFDDVDEKKDDQFLVFSNIRVDLAVRNGRVSCHLKKNWENLGLESRKKTPKKRKKNSEEEAA